MSKEEQELEAKRAEVLLEYRSMLKSHRHYAAKVRGCEHSSFTRTLKRTKNIGLLMELHNACLTANEIIKQEANSKKTTFKVQ